MWSMAVEACPIKRRWPSMGSKKMACSIAGREERNLQLLVSYRLFNTSYG